MNSPRRLLIRSSTAVVKLFFVLLCIGSLSTMISAYTLLGISSKRTLLKSTNRLIQPSPFLRVTKLSVRSASSTNSIRNNRITISRKITNSNNDSDQQQNKQQVFTQRKSTGGLRSLPVVKAPNEMISRARKVVYLVKPDKDIKNVRLRARKHGAETLNALMQALCVPLRDTITGYKRVWTQLHPFERVVFDLSVRARQERDGLTLQTVLDEINEGRKMILEATKEWIAQVKNAETAKKAGELTVDGQQYLLDMFERYVAAPISDLLDIQKSLRSAPVIDLDTPAVVLVGSPNVGKSSIVRAISSGTPEVNNYPFTTRGMTLGHVEVFWANATTIAKAVVPEHDTKFKKRHLSSEVAVGKYAFSQLCQIMDSPGLLVRPDTERNEMEALTLAAMQHLPTAVMYVMDLSGGAGDRCSSVQDQILLRKEIRQRFPRRPWIDVVSKYDLGVVDGALEELEELLGPDVPYIKLSVHEGIGLPELKSEVLRMLGDVRLVLDAMNAVAMEDQQQS